MATTKKTAAAPKATASKDVFAKVADTVKESSAQIVFDLMTSESDYATRVTTQGVILAKRIAAGEKQADIARELVAIGEKHGKKMAANTAAQRVSRYARIGMAIVKAPKGTELTDTIAKASKAVRGTKGPKVAPKTNSEKVAILLDSLVKVLVQLTQAELEQADTAMTTVITDVIANRYAELEKVAAA